MVRYRINSLSRGSGGVPREPVDFDREEAQARRAAAEMMEKASQMMREEAGANEGRVESQSPASQMMASAHRAQQEAIKIHKIKEPDHPLTPR